MRVSRIDKGFTQDLEVPESAPGPGLWLIESDDGTGERDLDVLKRLLRAPNDIANDVLAQRKPPKFMAEHSLWYLRLRGLDAETTDLHFDTIEICLVWTESVVFCRTSGPSVSMAATRQALADGWRPENAEQLVLRLSGAVFDRYLPLLVNLEDRLELLERALLGEGGDEWLRELVGYRTSLRVIRRINHYHTATIAHWFSDIVKRSGRTGLTEEMMQERTETLDRIGSLETMYYDMCGDLIDGNLSLSAHRLNEIMKVLTIITAIFVPLGLIAGIYGMNFQWMPELGWHYGYFGVLGLMALIASALIVTFRKRRWM